MREEYGIKKKVEAGRKLYKAYIGIGNNNEIVKNTLKKRSWWRIVNKASIDECSFIWTQWLKKKMTSKLQTQDEFQKDDKPIESTLIYNRIDGNR